MADAPPDNSGKLRDTERDIAEKEAWIEGLKSDIEEMQNRIALQRDAVREMRKKESEPDWIAPVRAILKPHEGELNKAIDILHSQVTEVGLDNTGRLTKSYSLVDGVEDQTGLEGDLPDLTYNPRPYRAG